MSDIDHWVELSKKCQYLPENDLKVMELLDYKKTFTVTISLIEIM